jgi:predicted Zn-dependent protease
MIMAMGMGIALIIINLLCIVFFFIVLVKLFKNEGALKGILGFFCSIYTFIWGWMKHKQLGMTKIMATWSILTIAGMVMVPVMGVSSALMIPSYLQQMSGNANIKIGKQQPSKRSPKINLARKNKKSKPTVNATKKKSVSRHNSPNMDWSQKAMALWGGDKYKDPRTAINYWNRAISSKQDTASAYNNRGLAYHELKQYQRAINDYNQAIKLDPEYAAAYNNRGNSYYELSEYQLALRDFNQSLNLEPKYAKAYLNRGLAYYQIDKNTEACNDFQNSCSEGDCDGIKWAMKNGICK